MTPCTWSLIKVFMARAASMSSIGDFPMIGNIGGRFYMNLSVMASLAAAFGLKGRFREANEQVFGRLPVDVPIPPLPMSRWRMIRATLPVALRMRRRVRANLPHVAAFVAGSPARCDALRAQIGSTGDAAELLALWRSAVEPHFHRACDMLEAATRQDGTALLMVRRDLRTLVGEEDANALTTAGDQLASLGPVLGLGRLAAGESRPVGTSTRSGGRPTRTAAPTCTAGVTATERESSAFVTGFPGAAGVVEGVVQVVPTVEDADDLRPGEILVTTVTNIGWTPLFPRAAAVLTDVGAPLSHAAIVARELGIPAVVGCGDATMRLHTGDRVRVDGAAGTVELLVPHDHGGLMVP
jgi:phosphohistidine swiveling domain-containing protein